MGDGAFTERYAASMENAPKPPLWIQVFVLLRDPHGDPPTEVDITDQLGLHLVDALGALRLRVGETDWYVQLAHFEEATTLEGADTVETGSFNTVLAWTASIGQPPTNRQMPPLPVPPDLGVSS